MQKKAAIFISSTYEDLKEERAEVIKSVLTMNHIPVGMEMFSAANDEQWKIITRHIDQADYYVIIVAHRYGSTGKDGISYTEREYDYAVSQGVPVYGFILDEKVPWAPGKMQAKNKKKLDAFKAKVRTKPCDFWTNAHELAKQVTSALTKGLLDTPRPCWVRAAHGTELDKRHVELLGRLDAFEELSKLAQIMQSSEAGMRVIDSDNKVHHLNETNLLQMFFALCIALKGAGGYLSTDKIGNFWAETLTEDPITLGQEPMAYNWVIRILMDMELLDLLGNNGNDWYLRDKGLDFLKHIRHVSLLQSAERKK